MAVTVRGTAVPERAPALHVGHRRHAHPIKRATRSISKHTVLMIIGVIFALPLYWLVTSSLKTQVQSSAFPPAWWPHPVDVHNYPEAFRSAPFGTYFRNTLFYCISTVVGVTLSSSLVAYGFARIQWKGRDALFMVMLATMMLPFLVTMIPQFVLFHYLGLVGTLLPLIIPTFFGGSVFSTFLLRQFFMTIPESLSDAARVDGASEFLIYWRIILPLARPALATVALFQFIFAWNDFLGPLIYTTNPSTYTLALGLQHFLSSYNIQWGLLMAGAAIMTAPIVFIFFFAQKTFIQGINITGLRG